MTQRTLKAMAFMLASILMWNADVMAQEILPKAGDPLPAFRLRQIVLNGTGRVTREDYVGQPLLIEFWGFK